MRLILRLLPFVLGLTLLPFTHAADTAAKASFSAILVSASKEKGPVDPKLAAYDSNLRRLLRFESFKYLGQGSANIALPGSGTVNLGAGQALALNTEESDGKLIKVAVRWQQGDRLLMKTGLALKPGVPAIVGGPSQDAAGTAVYAVILTAH